MPCYCSSQCMIVRILTPILFVSEYLHTVLKLKRLRAFFLFSAVNLWRRKCSQTGGLPLYAKEITYWWDTNQAFFEVFLTHSSLHGVSLKVVLCVRASIVLPVAVEPRVAGVMLPKIYKTDPVKTPIIPSATEESSRKYFFFAFCIILWCSLRCTCFSFPLMFRSGVSS